MRVVKLNGGREAFVAEADNDAMIGPGVVGQISIGSNVAHANGSVEKKGR